MIKVYSTNCPKCIVLEKKLVSEGIKFELVNSMKETYDASEKYNIKEAPFVVDGDKVYTFSEAFKNVDSFR